MRLHRQYRTPKINTTSLQGLSNTAQEVCLVPTVYFWSVPTACRDCVAPAHVKRLMQVSLVPPALRVRAVAAEAQVKFGFQSIPEGGRREKERDQSVLRMATAN